MTRPSAAADGRDVILLNGWGINGGVWAELAAILGPDCRLHCVDATADMDARHAWACKMAALNLEEATICGWSLGGQLALRLALTLRHQIGRVILIATTPRFLNGADWRCGMDTLVFDAFASDLQRAPHETLLRFAALQARGDTAARDVTRRLRKCIARAEPDCATLARGLQLLKDTDLRADLAQITQPVLILQGDRDSVVCFEAARYLERKLRHAKLQTIAGAAHAPFISYPATVARHISAFVHG